MTARAGRIAGPAVAIACACIAVAACSSDGDDHGSGADVVFERCAYPDNDAGVDCELHAASLSSDATARLAEVPLRSEFALSPDGVRVAFAESAGGRVQLRVVPASGGEGLVLDRARVDETLGDLAWSPDGRRLAYVADGASVRVASADGRTPPRILPHPAEAENRDCSSADHTRWIAADFIAYELDCLDEVYRIARIDGELNLPQPMQVVADGSRALYAHDEADGSVRITVSDLDGSNEVDLVTVSELLRSDSILGFSGAALSPRGDVLAYLDQGTLYALNLETMESTELVDSVGNFAWSPDGSLLAAHGLTSPEGSYEMSIVTPSGETRAHLAVSFEHVPFWTPSGDAMVVSREEGAFEALDAQTGELHELRAPAEIEDLILRWLPPAHGPSVVLVVSTLDEEPQADEVSHYLVPLDGSDFIELADANQYYGEWTGDGRFYVYKTPYDLRAISSDGETMRVISDRRVESFSLR